MKIRTIHWIPLIVFVVSLGCADKPKPDIRVSKNAQGQATSMELIGRNVLDSDLKELSKNPGLTDLKLQECGKVTDRGLAEIKSVAASLKKLEFIRVPITDEGLASLEGLLALEELHLAHTNVVGKGLSHLGSSPLKKLAIHSRTVKADELSSLEKLGQLEDLELHCQDISLKSLPVLSKLAQLKSLIAFRTPVGPDGMQVLNGLGNLKKLMLNSADINDASVPVMNTMTMLEEIELSNSTLTDEGIRQLKLPNLKKLSLDGSTKITDASLSNLQGFPNLESIMLGGTAVTGVDLTPLGTLKNLKEVLMMGKQYKGKEDAIKALKAILPNCEVIIMNG